MSGRTRKVRFLVSLASASWSYGYGQEVEAGAPGEIDLEEAGRYVSAGSAEWVKQRVEKATRKAPERATKGDRGKE